MTLSRKMVVFWQNFPSMHQRSFIGEFARAYGGEVELVVQSMSDNRRSRQGWSFSLPEGVRVSEKTSLISRLCYLWRTPSGSIQIVSGLLSSPGWLIFVLLGLFTTRAKWVVLAERPRKASGVRGAVKSAVYSVLMRICRGRIFRFFAIGSNAVEYYQRCGMSEDKIVEFGYFVDFDESVSSTFEVRSGVREFSVALIAFERARKGVDLVEWLPARCRGGRITWVHIGEPNLGLGWISLGAVPNSRLLEVLRSVDLLLVPSRFDGWGVVVNEALNAGCRVLCSPNVGAKDLVLKSGYGAVVDFYHMQAVIDGLKREVLRGSRTEDERREMSAWMSRNASPKSAAERMLKCLELAID